MYKRQDSDSTVLDSELVCCLQILCRFYVGRKAMFDSDFKGGILAELFDSLPLMSTFEIYCTLLNYSNECNI